MTPRLALFICFCYSALMFFAFPRLSSAEGGMIPMDAPAGEVGGRGHWYSLRTLRGKDYWSDPAVSTDIRENADGTYSIAGEPPISVSIVLHPLWYPEEPWRHALDWIRQAEQMFRNSGVALRFVVENIEVWDTMPDTVRAAYDALDFTKYEYGADLVVVLKPYMAGDPYCGVATIRGSKSVSSCSPVTLAHELGHNFGLYHSFNPGKEGRKGMCFSPQPDAQTCDKGTIMSYSYVRVPLFANKDFSYKQDPLGTEEHDAVAYLNSAKTGKSLRYELSGRDQPTLAHDSEEPETHFCR